MKKVIVFSLLVTSFFLFPRLLLAQSSIRSDNYRVLFPNLNSGAGVPTSASYKLGSTIGQTAAGLFSSDGYNVRSGFQYVHTIIPFSFSISDIVVDLGSLTPQTPSTSQSTLTVKAGGAGGYSVKAYENEPLTNVGANTIPNTICDGGTCTRTSAEVWTSGTTYGFGFNMNGDDVPSDFTDTTYFRPFADDSLSEAPASIMEKSEVTWDYPSNAWPWESEATITYKVNISAVQTAGRYQNIITYVAVPSY